MTQAELIILLFKVAIIFVIVATVGFIGLYTKLAPWWRNRIGIILVAKDLALLLAFIPPMLSFFFQFNRLTSIVSAWIDVSLFLSVGFIQLGQMLVWIKTHRDGNDRFRLH